MTAHLDDAVLARLRAVDTPTICNALERVTGSRRATGFTRHPVVCNNPALPAMVGFARCAKVRAASAPTISIEQIRANRMAYYQYVTSGPGPTIAVIEDTDWPNCLGAFWGELQVAVHRGLGVAGALTSGLLRDLGALDPEFQVVAGSVGPSHAFVHVIEIDVPVTILGLDIRPGDLIHADRHGAVNIPPEVASGLPDGIDRAAAREQVIIDAARRPGFNFAKLQQAWADAEKLGSHWNMAKPG